MIQTFIAQLPHGIDLSCRISGSKGAPVLMFLHGFPEAAFVWDPLLEHFAAHYRCIAPNLRGYEDSSKPTEVESYRAKHLVADIVSLIDKLGGSLEALVAHDWGGGVAWNLAVQHPDKIKRLVIVNSPHPATFLRDLQTNPVQQASSAYMNFLCRPDAEKLLSENDFTRLWPFFANMGAADPSLPGGGWLTDAVKEQYRAVWRKGLTGPLNYYRASPLRPPTADNSAVMTLKLAPELVTVHVPTLVIWGDQDTALRPSLLEGLETYVPKMKLVRVPQASHWIIHEQPERIAREIEAVL